MVKINKHIEIVRSSDSRLSSMSQRSCSAILAVLAKHYSSVGVTIVNNQADLQAMVSKKPDLVFLGMKFIPVDSNLDQYGHAKIWVTQYLDDHHIAYTGSSQVAHELELNKPFAKQCALDAGLMTSPFYVARQNQPQNRDNMLLTFPLFIKPTNRGGGLGVDSFSVAHNFDELESKVMSITTNHQSDSLVEEYLPGREFSVAILKDKSSDEFSIMPIELIAPLDKHGARFLSSEVKSADAERNIEVTDKIIKTKITTLAIDVFRALGARDYGRIDIRLDKKGVPQFLEANLLPSLIKDYGNFPKACMMNIKLGYEPMILSIVNLALARTVDVGRELLEPINSAGKDLPYPKVVLEPVS